MNYPFYNFESSDNHTFYFESISNKSVIPKAVVFTSLFQDADVYYLGFGDIQEDGTVDDLKISNNKDVGKVLATVIQTISVFLETYPDKKCFSKAVQKRVRVCIK